MFPTHGPQTVNTLNIRHLYASILALMLTSIGIDVPSSSEANIHYGGSDDFDIKLIICINSIHSPPIICKFAFNTNNSLGNRIFDNEKQSIHLTSL